MQRYTCACKHMRSEAFDPASVKDAVKIALNGAVAPPPVVARSALMVTPPPVVAHAQLFSSPAKRVSAMPASPRLVGGKRLRVVAPPRKPLEVQLPAPRSVAGTVVVRAQLIEAGVRYQDPLDARSLMPIVQAQPIVAAVHSVQPLLRARPAT